MAAALENGIARYALDKAARYARERNVWGVPIGAHQGIAHPLAKCKIDVELAAADDGEGRLAARPRPRRRRGLEHGQVRRRRGRLAALDQSIQVHGGNGLSTDFGLATLWGAARLQRTAPVSREMIFNYVASTRSSCRGPTARELTRALSHRPALDRPGYRIAPGQAGQLLAGARAARQGRSTMAGSASSRENELAAEYARIRPRLLRAAYALLGTQAEAEDVVADTWLRLAAADQRDRVADVEGWAVVAVSRRGTGRAAVGPGPAEAYVGPWLPEPLVDGLGGLARAGRPGRPGDTR